MALQTCFLLLTLASLTTSFIGVHGQQRIQAPQQRSVCRWMPENTRSPCSISPAFAFSGGAANNTQSWYALSAMGQRYSCSFHQNSTSCITAGCDWIEERGDCKEGTKQSMRLVRDTLCRDSVAWKMVDCATASLLGNASTSIADCNSKPHCGYVPTPVSLHTIATAAGASIHASDESSIQGCMYKEYAVLLNQSADGRPPSNQNLQNFWKLYQESKKAQETYDTKLYGNCDGRKILKAGMDLDQTCDQLGGPTCSSNPFCAINVTSNKCAVDPEMELVVLMGEEFARTYKRELESCKTRMSEAACLTNTFSLDNSVMERAQSMTFNNAASSFLVGSISLMSFMIAGLMMVML